jgi:hypothetical protein
MGCGPGVRLETETQMTYCFPLPPGRRAEGMMLLDNRSEILKCFEAFKAIVGLCMIRGPFVGYWF